MSEPISQQLLPKAKASKLYWWAILLYFALFSFNALATAVTAALIGVKWEQLTTQEKIMICIAVSANWTGLITVFIQRSVGRIISGRPPIETGDTKYLTRAQE
jgi:hypothetical protein